jgi:hypothetical protein
LTITRPKKIFALIGVEETAVMVRNAGSAMSTQQAKGLIKTAETLRCKTERIMYAGCHILSPDLSHPNI